MNKWLLYWCIGISIATSLVGMEKERRSSIFQFATIEMAKQYAQLSLSGQQYTLFPTAIISCAKYDALNTLLCELLDKHNYIEYKDTRSKTALHWAAQYNAVHNAQALIARKPSLVNEPDDRGWLPIHTAAWYGSIPVVQLLLTHGSLVNTPSVDELNTPLHMLIISFHQQIAQKVIAWNFRKIIAGDQPPELLQAVEPLCTHGALIELKNKYGSDVFSYLSSIQRLCTVAGECGDSYKKIADQLMVLLQSILADRKQRLPIICTLFHDATSYLSRIPEDLHPMLITFFSKYCTPIKHFN